MEIVYLEDNKKYIILDQITIENIKYVYLVESTDNEKKVICIRKLVDDEKNLAGLDSKEEYDKAFQVYIEKYKHITNFAWHKNEKYVYYVIENEEQEEYIRLFFIESLWRVKTNKNSL